MTDEQEEEEGLSAISSVTVRLERAFQVRSTSTNNELFAVNVELLPSRVKVREDKQGCYLTSELLDCREPDTYNV